MEVCSMIDVFKRCRARSVPLLAVNTNDPAATVAACTEVCNGKAAVVEWDCVRGFTGRNEAGRLWVQSLDEIERTMGVPTQALVIAQRMPERSLLCIHLAHRWLDDPTTVQAVWNLRTPFKVNARTLLMLAKAITLPSELQDDVVVLDEPLPTEGELKSIVAQQFKDAGLKECEPQTLTRAGEALRGLSAFAAEQATALSLTKAGLESESLWERKRKQIEQTPGLKVYRDGGSFDQIGGCERIKGFLGQIMRGKARPNCVVFIDEIEKAMAGATGGDLSGTSADQLGLLLSYMQDNKAAGCIFVGPPGAAKSAIAKAAGTEGGVPTIQLDLGAAKGSLVGQSEQQIRTALKVISAVSDNRSLWIATCNSIADLPPELRRRFTLGTYFFDLPTAEEREAIWSIYLEQYEIDASRTVDSFHDDGWTGAEIRQCCEIAWRLDCSLADAASYVVPVSRSAADKIRKLRENASGKFLSASHPGVFEFSAENAAPVASAGGRSIRFED
jgi:hypothetical protein